MWARWGLCVALVVGAGSPPAHGQSPSGLGMRVPGEADSPPGNLPGDVSLPVPGDWPRGWANLAPTVRPETRPVTAPIAVGPRDDRGIGSAEEAACDHEEEYLFPDPFGRAFDRLNPARLHRRLDEVLGFDTSDQSEKPEAPRIPRALFREVNGPLGALKYQNQVNYFGAAFTGNAPDLQRLTGESAFADWNVARFELAYLNGELETLLLGYHRTLGVGRRHNWVHGALVLPEYFVKDGLVGGSALYTFAWKPEQFSPWSTAVSVGALRGPVELANIEEEARIWRPLIDAGVWYTFSPSLSVGVETSLLPSSQFGQYLVLPHVNWSPSEHMLLQLGAGYYQFGSESQAVFMVRAKRVNHSPREPRRRGDPRCEHGLRRWLGRD